MVLACVTRRTRSDAIGDKESRGDGRARRGTGFKSADFLWAYWSYRRGRAHAKGVHLEPH